MANNNHSDTAIQRNIVITVDYEVFGNGTGDVRQHIISPMERMADLGKRYRFPFTIFVEVEEYVAFCKYAEQLRAHYNYDPAELIRSQVKLLVSQGHDIQLHIHPQWFNAVFENGAWRLNHHFIAVDDMFATQSEVTEYISERKKMLEEIVYEADPTKSIAAYRAGAFCAQPGRKLITALAENNILIDSSVVKGLLRRSKSRSIDYRSALDRGGYWRIVDDVCTENSLGRVYEFPIFSKMKRRWNQIGLRRLHAKFSKNVPKVRRKEMLSELGISANPFNFIAFLFQPVAIKLDFHNLPTTRLFKMASKAAYHGRDEGGTVTVMIGHTKEHTSNQSLEHFFKLVESSRNCRIVTFSDIAELIKSDAFSKAG